MKALHIKSVKRLAFGFLLLLTQCNSPVLVRRYDERSGRFLANEMVYARTKDLKMILVGDTVTISCISSEGNYLAPQRCIILRKEQLHDTLAAAPTSH